MTHGSLFSGIGGFDLAAECMGWENKFHCEWNEFGQKVLKYYWPNAELFTDITKSDFTKYANKIDILTGGFPCQPYSTAGKRLGKEDERHLWPKMLRAIWEIQPRFVVGENVSGLLSWNGGMVFDEVQADLEAAGYEVIPFILPACGVNAPHRRDRIFFVAHAINGGHNTGRGKEAEKNGVQGIGGQKMESGEFDRTGVRWSTTNPHHTGSGTGLGQVQEANGEIPQWNNDAEFSNAGDGITKNPNGDGCGSNKREGESGIRGFGDIGTGDNERIPANDAKVGIASGTTGEGRKERQQVGGRQNTTEDSAGMDNGTERFIRNGYASNPGSIELQGGMHPDGTGAAERYPGSRNPRIDKCGNWDNFPTKPPIRGRNDGLSPELVGITVSKHRQESIKGYGNAIVPQVALQIFKAIQLYDTTGTTEES